MKIGCLIPLSVLIGFVLDSLIGDPPRLPHPIRFIGALISALEKKLLRADDKPEGQRKKGVILVIAVAGATAGVTALIVGIAHLIHPLCALMVDSILCAYCLAAKSLKDASMKVCRDLEDGDLRKARYDVSMIVGRDTEALDEKGVARAAIESVAESTSDGVIAPLFYLMIGGPVLGMAYKSINTMDSMVGYMNDKYRYYGTAAAKLDDIVNFIPARLSALALIAASALTGLNTGNAVKIFRRDRYNHKSPNSAQTESVCAGALGLQLAGDAVYFGKTVKKPTIGDALKEVEPEDIRRANRLMYAAAVLSIIVMALIRLCVI